jgi:aminopeptidase YwaD
MRKRSTRFSFILALAVLFSARAQSQTDAPPGVTLEQIRAIIDTASGDRALNHIRELTLHHRWFVSDGYFDAARYVEERAEEIGLQDVRIERFPSDGEIVYSTSESLPKWTVRSAHLSLVSPVEKHLVSWEENPIVLASNSRSADVEAELVDVGEGVQASDYDGKDVRGKLVLASSPQGKGRIETVHRLAVLERGAVGVVSYRSYYLDDFPDLITWDHIWTFELNGRQSTFGFCISKRMGWQLKRLLDKGDKVVLHAEVDAELSAGEYGVVTGHIPGTDLSDQEIWFVAHLDHCRPSANDNASGSAGILEAARTLKTLVDVGALEPRRTIRFLWVPEIYGSYAYISKHLEETRKAVAVINMDMVGENQELCGSTFRVTETPDSTPSFFNDLLSANLDFMLAHDYQPGLELVDPFMVVSPLGTHEPWKAQVIPYSGGSDHYVFMGGVVNIPATMLGSWPDYFYHSSGDTPDKSDATQLERAVVYGVMLGAGIAQMSRESGLDLFDLLFNASLVRLEEAAGRARALLESSELSGRDLKEAMNILGWAGRREESALASVAMLLPGDQEIAARMKTSSQALASRTTQIEASIDTFYRDLCKQRGQKAVSVPELTDEEKRAQTMVPVRNPAFPGPISTEYLSEKLAEEGKDYNITITGFALYELNAFIDGKRSALEIRDAVSAECGAVQISDVVNTLNTLETAGLVTFK